MKKSTSQGSAHVVIIVVLIVALLGALGFVFYQNFIAKKDATQDATSASTAEKSTSQTKETSKTPALLTGSIDKGFGTPLGFSYPDTWKLESQIKGPMPLNYEAGATSQTISITSPTAKTVVKYEIGAGGGLGGACDPADGGTVTDVTYQAVTGFPAASYAEYTVKGATWLDGRHKQLLKTDSAKALVTGSGKTYCDVSMQNIIPLDTSRSIVLFDASITKSDAGAAEEFDQAKAILLSTTH